MNPDFNRLRVFYTVMTAGGVGAAARVLHVTQSAVSQHLSRLEAEIQTPLFTRLQNRLVPTNAAERLFAVMTPFIKDLDTTLAQLQHARTEPFGCLRIGAPVEFGVHYLPPCFASFRERFPHVQFELAQGHPIALMPQLERGHLDMAFVDLFATSPTQHHKHDIFNFDPVMSEALVLVSSTQYFQDKLNGQRGYESLRTANYVTYQQSAASLKSWFRHHYKKVPGTFNVTVTVESVQTVKALIKAGLGLGVLPQHLIADDIAQKQLVQFSNRAAPLCNHIALVTLLDKKLTLTEKTFISHLKATLLAVVGSP